MAAELFEFQTPNFLLCEKPIKTGESEDQRLWVYCVKNLTLIECISLEYFGDVYLNAQYKVFNYKNERWALVFVQNNVEATDGNEEEVMNEAWAFLEKYLKWEDRNIDNQEIAGLN